jgi:hypothetical protein
MKLHNMLEVFMGKKKPWEERETDELVYGVCLASSIDEERCKEIYSAIKDAKYVHVFEISPEMRENAVRAVNEVMERFEIKGSCLVERGVNVEDPSVCGGDIDERMTVIGSRMQFSVDSSLHNMVIRFNGACIVSTGEETPLKPYNIRRLRSGKRGLLGYDEVNAIFSVGQCGLSDLPRLLEETKKLNYGDVYYECRVNESWDEESKSPEEEDAEYEAIDEEYENVLKILRGE